MSQGIALSSETEKRGGIKAGIIWFTVALFYLYEYVVRVAPGVMEAEMEMAFGVNTEKLSLSLATYYYVYAPMQLIVGILFDRFGGKKLLVPATLMVAVGCYMATCCMGNLTWLTIGRVLMGCGSAFGFVGAIYIATIWYPPNRIAFISGLTTGLGMLGAIIAETLLASMVDHSGWENVWHQLFYSGLILAAILYWVIPKPPKWELERREKAKNDENQESFIKGLLKVCKNKQTWFIGCVGGCLFLPLSLFADLWGMQYITHVSEVSKTTAGSAISMIYLGWLIGGPIAGWYSDFKGTRKKPMMWGLLTSALMLWGMLLFPELPFNVLCLVLFVSGLLCSAEVICFVSGIEANSLLLRGTSIAVINMIVTIIGGVCQPIVGHFLHSRAHERMLEDNLDTILNTAADYRSVMMILPIVMLLGLVAGKYMNETFKKDQKEV